MLPLKNAMEDLVVSRMDEVLRQYPNCCQCEKCRRDIAILALNHLPPRYVSTVKGSVFAKLSNLSVEGNIEIIGQIAKAVQVVSQHPHHDEEEI